MTVIRIAFLISFALLAGCASRKTNPDIQPSRTFQIHHHNDSVPIFDSNRDGDIDSYLTDVFQKTDIILFGEQHSSGTDHEFQMLLLEAMIKSRRPVILSMEMLERDEQADLDLYLCGMISQENFVTDTESSDWAGPGTWDKFYQPMIELCRDAGYPVIAANAPRRFSQLVVTEGFEALLNLPEYNREWFAIPVQVDDRPVYERFTELIGNHDGIDESTVRSFYRGQQLWDGTMGKSVADAWYRFAVNNESHLCNDSTPSPFLNPALNPLLIHLTGRFHVEYDGGLYLQVINRLPDVRVATITLQDELPEPAPSHFVILMDEELN